jgi:hypothetical protein
MDDLDVIRFVAMDDIWKKRIARVSLRVKKNFGHVNGGAGSVTCTRLNVAS